MPTVGGWGERTSERASERMTGGWGERASREQASGQAGGRVKQSSERASRWSRWGAERAGRWHTSMSRCNTEHCSTYSQTRICQGSDLPLEVEAGPAIELVESTPADPGPSCRCRHDGHNHHDLPMRIHQTDGREHTSVLLSSSSLLGVVFLARLVTLPLSAR